NPHISAALAALVAERQPELVHIHHLTHLSTELVPELARRQIPVLFTLHDYWLLCQRGQLLDLELQRCQGPGPVQCARCLGLGVEAGPLRPAAARAARRIDPRLAALVSWAAQRTPRLRAGGEPSSSGAGQAAARLHHIRAVSAQVTR